MSTSTSRWLVLAFVLFLLGAIAWSLQIGSWAPIIAVFVGTATICVGIAVADWIDF